LLLHAPDLDEPIKITGRIIHNSSSDEGEDGGIGVEFIDIDEKSREMLIKNLRRQKD